MTFVVISEDGELTVRDLPANRNTIEAEVGIEGWATVRLYEAPALYGFVNDCGLVMPDKYKRNPIGGCVLASFGASQQPYAGPVVVTGWDEYSDGPEIRDLSEDLLAGVTRMHAAVKAALDGGGSEFGEPWDQPIREYAGYVLTGEHRGLQFFTLDDVGVTVAATEGVTEP